MTFETSLKYSSFMAHFFSNWFQKIIGNSEYFQTGFKKIIGNSEYFQTGFKSHLGGQ